MSITWSAAGLAAFSDITDPYGAADWTLPTGVDTDDLMIAIAGWKPKATSVSITSGWDARGDQSTTSGQSWDPAVSDEGDVRIAAWSRVHDGSETAPTATPSGEYSPLMLAMLSGASSASGAGWALAVTTGSDDTPTPDTVSVTGGSLTWATGDSVVVCVAANSNASGPEGSAALSIANCTVSALTQQLATVVTSTGADAALNVFTAEVTAGGTGAPTYTSTSGSSSDSHRPVLFIKVSEPSGSTGATATPSAVASAAAVDAFATCNASIVIGGESKQGVWA